jgi:hypothetical protein
MHNHGFTRQAQFRLTPVIETVHASDGSTDCVRVVPVRVEGMRAEERFKPLQLRSLGSMSDPVSLRWEILHGGAPVRLQIGTFETITRRIDTSLKPVHVA